MSSLAQRVVARERRPTYVAAFVVAVLLAIVVQQSWGGRPVTWDSLVFMVVVGVTIGSIYAIFAMGLVVTYTTSGIFNFAQGAMGMFCAFIYWQLKVDGGMQTLVAFLLTVLVAAPVLGALIERILMRRLSGAPLVAQLVVTIGLMVFLMGLAVGIWDPSSLTRQIPSFFGTTGFQLGETFVPWYRFIAIVTGLGIALALRFLLYRSRLGVSMRAVVDNRDLAALNGARPGRTSMFAWALGTSMSAVAGIFLAQELSNLSVETLTLFIVDAFAAAIIGRLKSLPLTYLGGMIIGLSISFQQNFLLWSGRWSSARFAIPTMILFLALLFLPQARIEGRRITSTVTARLPSMKRATLGFGVLFAFMAVNATIWDRIGIRNLAVVMLVAFPMLSLVPLTGWSGQISLAQITFVGVGAWALVEFSTGGGGVFGLELFGNGSPWGLLLAALVAVPIGLVMALPALRLQGLYLALATMAFARMSEFVIFDQPEVFGNEGKRIAPLEIFGYSFGEPFSFLGINFGPDAAYLLFVTAVFCVVGLGVVLLRRSRFGRRLVAMRDSPAACATLGVNLFSTKLAVFGLSAAVAGLGGALLGMQRGSAGTADFQMIAGLPWLLLLVVGGVAVVSGAVFGGFALQSFVWLTLLFPASAFFEWWQRLGPGLAGIGIGRRPDGVIPHVSEELREKGVIHRGTGPPPAAIPPPEPEIAAAGARAPAASPGA